jgi:predicted aconitase
MRSGAFPPDGKILDVMKANLMMLDILLEENDRMAICGTVNVMDHEKISWALMVQMTPAIAKKMTTVLQVTFSEPQTAISYLCQCYTFKCILTYIESSAGICSLDTWYVEISREGPGALHET